jgi:hypothetical protein
MTKYYRSTNGENNGDSGFVILAHFVIRISSFSLALHFQQQHRHIDFMAHFVHRRAVENVANESVAMRGHRDQIHILLAGELNDLVGGFAKREDGVAGKTFGGQFAAAFFQVKTVLFHLVALCELELIEIARHPAVGHMDEEEFCAGHLRKRPNVRENGLIGWAVFERDEDMLIHFKNGKSRVSNHEKTVENV